MIPRKYFMNMEKALIYPFQVNVPFLTPLADVFSGTEMENWNEKFLNYHEII